MRVNYLGTNKHKRHVHSIGGLKVKVWRDIIYLTTCVIIVGSIGYKHQHPHFVNPIGQAHAETTLFGLGTTLLFTSPSLPTPPPHSEGMLYDVRRDNPAEGWESFVNKIKAIAPIYDFPVNVAVSQAALESDRGNSDFARNRHNYFGIGAYDSNPDDAFTFANDEQCIIEYMRLIKSRFADAYASRQNPSDMVELLQGTYATDPDYAAKLKSLPEWGE